MNTQEQISNLIKEAMQEKGCNQTQFAAAIGVTKQTLSLWVRGASIPKFETLSKLRKHEDLWVREFAVRMSMILVLG